MFASLALLYIFPRFNNTYTYLSLVNGLYAYFFNFNQMVPMLFANHLAIVLGYHSTWFGDNDIIRNSTKERKYFWIENMMHHFAPTLFYGWYIYSNGIRTQSPHLGVISLMYQLLWRYRVSDSFLLDNIYIKSTPEAWYIGWACTCMVQLITPMVLYHIQGE